MRIPVILFIAYLLVLFKLLFFKVKFAYSDISISGNEHTPFSALLKSSNFKPFYRIYYYASGQEPYEVGMLNIFGNILLFVPMGFFLPYFFKRLNSLAKVAAVTAIISLVVEVLQLATATGEFDVDDVVLNTIGGAVGYFLFKKTGHFFTPNGKPSKTQSQ